jgi:hypothetical protein
LSDEQDAANSPGYFAKISSRWATTTSTATSVQIGKGERPLVFYLAHLWHRGWSILDVTDPDAPQF